MNKERLLNVARATREMKNPHMFDMTRWGWGDGKLGSCGTPGCALGNYAHRTDLQDTFKLVDGRLVLASNGREIFPKSPVVLEHFGITAMQSAKLFNEDGCGGTMPGFDEDGEPIDTDDAVLVTHTEAADYIENFVKEHSNGQ